MALLRRGHFSYQKFTMAKLTTSTRLIILISALLMVISFFVPIWQILMWAPQYPEGLEMKIWLHTISGDYKIISGLNHYIGMKHIDIDMFPEFGYMRYIVMGMITIGMLAALINRKGGLIAYVLVILAAACAGLIDFYMWGYDYGHNLDPTAPIIVPGMAYQPPLIGTKQLLNFTAYSGPDTGGWIFLVSGLLAIGALIYDWKLAKHPKPVQAVALVLLVLLTSCNATPEPLQFGKDSCHSCKMVIFDKHYGGEIVSSKGKIFKFDDSSCMINFLKSGVIFEDQISHELLIDFANPGTLIDARSAHLVFSEALKTPMNGRVAAFSSSDAAAARNAEWNGKLVEWKVLKKQH